MFECPEGETTMTKRWVAGIASFLLAGVTVLPGCQTEEPPATTVGEAVDHAADKTRGALEATGEKLGEMTGKAGEKLGEMGEKAGELGKAAANKTGEVIEKSGEALEKLGEKIQGKDTVVPPPVLPPAEAPR
jgi:hypothetical protein